jgi:hypothetical protein
MKHVNAMKDEKTKADKEPRDWFNRAETRDFFNKVLRTTKDTELKDEEFNKLWDKIPKAKPAANAPAAAPAKGKDAKGPADDGAIVTQANAIKAIVKEAQVRLLCEIPPPSLEEMINAPEENDPKAETDLNAFFNLKDGVLSDVALVHPISGAHYK